MARLTLHSLADHFADLPDPRLDRQKRHELVDIIVLTICSILAGGKTWTDVERFGQSRVDWFRTFLKLPNGIPSHDTIGRFFSLLNAAEFEKRFEAWMAEVCAALGFEQVAVDGKTMRGSRRGPNGSAIHVVSAFATANGITLGQRVVAEKSNEITAIPELLKTLEIAGALVTIDAMGCQTKIVETIREKKADYLLAVKENQPTLYNDIHQFATQALGKEFAGIKHDYFEKQERSHGRNEFRACYVFDAKDVVVDRTPWKDLKSIVMIVSEREVNGKATSEVRYYISSRETTAELFAAAVRNHWGVENGLHWMLDVNMGDDASRVRNGNGPQNFALLKRLALAVLKQAPGTKANDSVRGKSLLAGWDHAYLIRLLEEFLRI